MEHSAPVTISTAERVTVWIQRHWLFLFGTVIGTWIFLPWLAPVLIWLGFPAGGNAIYHGYTVFCHQLPERSYFLFGSQTMYPISDIHQVWPYTDFAGLRGFIGTPEMGFKVAWSDRMVSFYTPLFVGFLLMGYSRQKNRRRTGNPQATSGWKFLPIWLFALTLLPLAIDGGTHFINDIINFGGGFRDTNGWLALLTHNVFPATFYAGDAIGSFNWWMRLFTGLLAGFGMVFFFYPYFEEAMDGETMAADTPAGGLPPH